MNQAASPVKPLLSSPHVQQPVVFNGNSGSSGKRARATGQTLEYLKEQFSRNPNPTIEARREICARTGMHEKVIRIWFQNYRAKMRKSERLATRGLVETPKPSFAPRYSLLFVSQPMDPVSPCVQIPVLAFDVNAKYSYIEASSVSAGAWHRSRLGVHSVLMLAGSLHHLSPKAVLAALGTTNMLIILSKKNAEMNYFFMPEEGARILFRIFFPLSLVSECRLVSPSLNDAEMRISLSGKPQFAVHYPEKDYNKWEMSPDFTEGNQVSVAHFGTCGNDLPHIITGPSPSLEYLRTYVTAYIAATANTSISHMALDVLEGHIPEYDLHVENDVYAGQTHLASNEHPYGDTNNDPADRMNPAIQPPTPASSTSKLHEVNGDAVSEVSPYAVPLTPYDSHMGIDETKGFHMEYQHASTALPFLQYDFSDQTLYAPPAASCGERGVEAVNFFGASNDLPTDSDDRSDHGGCIKLEELDTSDGLADLATSYTSYSLDAFLDFEPLSHLDESD